MNVDVVQANGVDGMLVLNRGESEWWSFFDISLLNSSVCGDLMGPMAIVVSEETPRKCRFADLLVLCDELMTLIF